MTPDDALADALSASRPANDAALRTGLGALSTSEVAASATRLDATRVRLKRVIDAVADAVLSGEAPTLEDTVAHNREYTAALELFWHYQARLCVPQDEPVFDPDRTREALDRAHASWQQAANALYIGVKADLGATPSWEWLVEAASRLGAQGYIFTRRAQEHQLALRQRDRDRTGDA